MRAACEECRTRSPWPGLSYSWCTHDGPHGPETATRITPGWLYRLGFTVDRLDEDPGPGQRAQVAQRAPKTIARLAAVTAGTGAILLAVADFHSLLRGVVISVFLLVAAVLVRVVVTLRRTGLALVRWQDHAPQRKELERPGDRVLLPAPHPKLTHRTRVTVTTVTTIEKEETHRVIHQAPAWHESQAHAHMPPSAVFHAQNRLAAQCSVFSCRRHAAPK